MTVGDQCAPQLDEVKPRLRGWLHAATVPIDAGRGLVLIVLSDHRRRLAWAPRSTWRSALLLFGVSRRLPPGPAGAHGLGASCGGFDHANIFLLIAGSYTPFTILLLDGTDARILLSVVWGGALLGVVFRVFWTDAPRWLYIPVYVALGWAAVFWSPTFAATRRPPYSC